MTSPRRRQGSPIDSVSLTFSFITTKAEASELKKAVASTTYSKGVCKVSIKSESLRHAGERAKELLELLRKDVSVTKGFKGTLGSPKRKIESA